MTTGTIKNWINGKGFGFIARDDDEPDVFVHITRIIGSNGAELFVGDRVQFEIGTNPRNGKTEAQNVRLIAA